MENHHENNTQQPVRQSKSHRELNDPVINDFNEFRLRIVYNEPDR